MADRIKGITIEIGGDTTGLNKALSGTNKEIRNTQSQLKDVERLLKLDPTNTELLKQKQKLLADAVKETAEKLEKLKNAEKQAQQQFTEGKISQEQYEGLQREIVATEQSLKQLEDRAERSNAALERVGAAGKHFQEIGGKITGVGKKLLPVTGIITAAGGASAKMAMDFEDAMAKVNTIADTAEVPLTELKDAIIDLSDQTGISSSEIAENVYNAISAGQKTGDAVNFVSNAAKLAKAGFADSASALDVLTTIMNAYELEATEVSKVSDILIQTQNLGKTTVGDLSASMGKIIPTAKANGVALEQVAAGYATMTVEGIATAETTTYMNSMLNELGKSGTKVSNTLKKKTGKSFRQLMDDGNSLADVLEVISDSAAEQGLAFSDLWGSAEGGKAAMTLLGDGAEKFNGTLKQMQDSTGATEAAFGKLDTKSYELQKTINKLKNDAAEMGQSILDVLAPMLEKLSEKIQELHEWFNGLSDDQKNMVVKIGLVAAAAGPLLIVLGQMASGIGAVMTAVGVLGPMISGLSAAGGPLALAVTAVGAIGVAMYGATRDANNYYENLSLLSEEEQNLIDKTDVLYNTYQQGEEARLNASLQTQDQAEKERELWKELQNITDVNGKVKEGCEERARVITSTLAAALGIEIGLVGDQITNYDELSKMIDTVIQKKQAEAILDSNGASYTEAMQSQTTAYMDYLDAQKAVHEKTEELNQAKENEAEITDKINRLMKDAADGIPLNTFALQQLKDEQSQASNEAHGYADGLVELNSTLEKAGETYSGYSNIIQNYSQLSSASVSGSKEEIAQAITDMIYNFQTAESSTAESLEKQHQNFVSQYAAMKEAVESGAPGVTQAQVDNMKNLVDRSGQELGKLPQTADKPILDTINAINEKGKELSVAGTGTGRGYIAGFSGGITAGAKEVADAAGKVAQASADKANSVLDIHSPSGITHGTGLNYDAGLAGGIIDGASQVTGAVNAVANGAAEELSRALQGSQSSVQGYQKTMTSGWSAWASSLTSQHKAIFSELSTITKNAMDALNASVSSSTNSTGRAWAKSWEDVRKSHKETMDGIEKIHETAMKEIEDVNRIRANKTKEDTIKAFRDTNEGIRRELGNLPGIVRSGVDPATNCLVNLKNNSPAWGKDMMSGFISGIRSKIGELERACRNVSGTVSDYMHFTRPEKGPLRDYEEWMPHMMEGLSDGIRDNMWRITDEVKTMTNAISVPIAGTRGHETDIAPGNMASVTELLNQYLPSIAEQKYVMMDRKTLVGYIAGEMDRSLGEMQVMKGRT